MAFNIDELTPEQIQKGLACKSLEEFQAFVKDQGFDLEEDEAQAYFEEMYEMELTEEELQAVAGGGSWIDAMSGCDHRVRLRRHRPK